MSCLRRETSSSDFSWTWAKILVNPIAETDARNDKDRIRVMSDRFIVIFDVDLSGFPKISIRFCVKTNKDDLNSENVSKKVFSAKLPQML